MIAPLDAQENSKDSLMLRGNVEDGFGCSLALKIMDQIEICGQILP
jgi:hypothetical protein